MKKQLQQISNNKTGKRIMPVLFTLSLMLSGMMGMAQTAYITNSGDNTVYVINVATNSITDTITVGSGPYAVSVSADGTRVYVTNGDDNTVSVINTATNTVLATIPVGAQPWGIAVTPDGGKVYVANNTGNTVRVINTATNSVIDSIIVGIYPWGVCASPNGNKIYVTNNWDGTVSVINTNTNTVSATIPVGSNPIGISASPDGSKIYVANNGGNTVNVINTATNTVVATINVDQWPMGLTVSPNGSKIYTANYVGNTASVINSATNIVSATIGVGIYPEGVSVSPDGSKLYVVDNNNDLISVINTATNTVSDTINVGSEPVAFGNFISTYPFITPCSSKFYIAADGTQLHHYLITNNAYGRQPLHYVWSWGDGSHDTIPYPSHTYADSGFYNICLSITDSAGCQSTFCDSSFHALRTTNTMVYMTVVNPLVTEAKEVSLQTAEVALYPNPANNQLTIHSSAFRNEAVMVSVMNVMGQAASPPTPLQKRGESAVIDISGLPSGMYFVQLKGESGSVVKKFVKE